MKYELEFDVKIAITLDDEEFELLSACMESIRDKWEHSSAFEPGAFWYNYPARRVQWGKEETLNVTIRNINGPILRALEYMQMNPGLTANCYALYQRFQKVWRTASEKGLELNVPSIKGEI